MELCLLATNFFQISLSPFIFVSCRARLKGLWMCWCHRRDRPGYGKKRRCAGVCLGGGDVGDLVRKTALLEGKLVEARHAREVVEERFCRLMNSSSEGVQQLVAFEVGRHEQFKELSRL
jgi:hypothetical protein